MSGLRRMSVIAMLSVTLAMAFTLLVTAQAVANPKDIPQGSHKVYQFNLIGYPAGKTYDGGCGEGNRIFVNREANKAQILVTNGMHWNVTDCDATGDRRGELTTSNAAVYDVYVRILGKKGGTLRICADTYEDWLAGETLCLLGTIDLTRGQHSKFSVAPSAMFDASLEDLMWTVDTNKDFRICQFRVYERP